MNLLHIDFPDHGIDEDGITHYWKDVPVLKYKVEGRPLPKGMSKCVVGFIVRKRNRG
jgi:hypothetical protein